MLRSTVPLVQQEVVFGDGARIAIDPTAPNLRRRTLDELRARLVLDPVDTDAARAMLAGMAVDPDQARELVDRLEGAIQLGEPIHIYVRLPEGA